MKTNDAINGEQLDTRYHALCVASSGAYKPINHLFPISRLRPELAAASCLRHCGTFTASRPSQQTRQHLEADRIEFTDEDTALQCSCHLRTVIWL